MIDFIPYFDVMFNNNIDYNYEYRLNNFYFCNLSDSTMVQLLINISIYITMFNVPAANGILFYLYVSKLHKLLRQDANANIFNDNRSDQLDRQAGLSKYRPQQTSPQS